MGKKQRDELSLVTGEPSRYRKKSATKWTKRKECDFLAVLGETCNVSKASVVAGVGATSAFRRRTGDPAFRSAWLEALAMAYQRLELALLERAINGIRNRFAEATAPIRWRVSVRTSLEWRC